MNQKMREYLFSLTPLFIACPIVYLLQVEFPHLMIFVIAYLWHLFLAFPGTPEKMSQRGYRFAFVRLIYLLFAKLNQWINKRKIFIVESLFRALGPFLFMLAFHIFYGGINFYMLILGSVYFEMILFTRRHFEGRVPPPLP